MLALRFTTPSPTSATTAISEVAEPEPGPGQIAIDVTAAGINFVDVIARGGNERYAPVWPHHPGHEVAGTIRSLGADVVGFTVGQRVVASTPEGGGLAEVALADARLVVAIPDGVTSAAAATAPAGLATALLLLTDAGHWRAGGTLLLHSASGGVGGAVAQIAAALGGGVLIGTVGSAAKVDDARRRGWDVVLVRDEHTDAAVRAQAPDGVDLILDPIGGGSVTRGLGLLAPLGRIVVFGNAAGEPPQPLPPHGELMAANAAVGGLSITALSRQAPHRLADATRRALDLLASGAVAAELTEVHGLGAVAAVHDLLAAGRGSGKYAVSL